MKTSPLLRSLRGKLLLLLLLFSTVPVIILGLWTVAEVEQTFRDFTFESLQALASAKAQAIDQFTADRKAEVERIANLVAPRLGQLLVTERMTLPASVSPDADELPALADGLPPPPNGQAAASPPPAAPADDAPPEPPARQPLELTAARDALEQTLGLILWDQRQFEELLVLDLQGRVMASTFPEHAGHSASDLDYFKSGLGTTYTQPVFQSPITGQLTTVISTPIRDADRQPIGVLAARLNLSRFFRLINDVTGLGQTGETMVGRVVEDRVVLMAPTRHDPEAALRVSIPIDGDVARPLQEAVRGRSGFGESVDYRGQRVFAAWEDVPSLEWGLVVKLDRSEARAPVTAARAHILGLLLLLLIAGIIASAAAARLLVEPLGQLKNATDRISRGDFDVQLDIRSQDEIGELAASFERMVTAIRYFRQRSSGEAIAEEMAAEEALLAEERRLAEREALENGPG